MYTYSHSVIPLYLQDRDRFRLKIKRPNPPGSASRGIQLYMGTYLYPVVLNAYIHFRLIRLAIYLTALDPILRGPGTFCKKRTAYICMYNLIYIYTIYARFKNKRKTKFTFSAELIIIIHLMSLHIRIYTYIILLLL